MTNRETMLTALKTHTFPFLREHGFQGTHPHYYKICGDTIALISFQDDKYGHAFLVEVSAVFPNRKDKNLTSPDNTLDVVHRRVIAPDGTVLMLNPHATNRRKRLDGMFDGKFYYADVYRKRQFIFPRIFTDYQSVTVRENALPFVKNGYTCVQQFNSATAENICKTVNKQLQKSFRDIHKL